MRLIHHFRPLMELGRCKEFVMASKTTDSSKRRGKKAASVQIPPVVESRRDVVPGNAFAGHGLEEQIRRRAYELYLERGATPGNESEDWITAEREVRSREMHQAG